MKLSDLLLLARLSCGPILLGYVIRAVDKVACETSCCMPYLNPIAAQARLKAMPWPEQGFVLDG